MIRRAEPSDLPRLNAIMFGSRAYTGIYRRIIEGYDLTATYLESHVVNLDDGNEGARGFYSLQLDGEAELDLLFCADEFQGQGVGAQLFAHMLETAKDAGTHRVRIVSHPLAVGFYERQGAIKVGVSPATGLISWSRPILVVLVHAMHP